MASTLDSESSDPSSNLDWDLLLYGFKRVSRLYTLSVLRIQNCSFNFELFIFKPQESACIAD